MSLNEEKNMSTETNKKTRPFWKVLLLHLGLMGAALILVLWLVSVFMDLYTHHGKGVEMPDVSGLSTEEAESYLLSIGLKPMVVDSVYFDARPGSVIEQNPIAGIPVKKGRNVYLTVNAKEKRTIKMIDVREWSSRQGQSKLTELGFVIDSVRQVAYEFDDLILGVNLPGGKEVTPGKEYPYHTHIVVRVGSTHVAIVAENDSTESAWLE